MDLLDLFKLALSRQKNPASSVTIKNYASDVRHFTIWFEATFKSSFDPAQVSVHTIERYKRDCLENAIAVSSLERHLSSIRKFFEILASIEYIDHNPFTEIPPKPLPKDLWKLLEFRNSLYETYNLSTLSIKNYISDLKQFTSWVDHNYTSELENLDSPFLQITKQLLENYRDALHKTHGLSVASINRKLSALRKYLHWAYAQNHIQASAFKDIANVPEYKAPSFKSADEPESLTYSSIPALAFAQKTSDFLLINPIANLVQTISLYAWKLSGERIFTSLPLSKGRQKVYTLKNSQAFLPNKPYVFSASLAAPLSVYALPFHKKILHHARFTRPEWYKKYHSCSFSHYLHFAILLLSTMLGTLFVYKSYFLPGDVLGQSTASFSRMIPYQGRLLFSDENPVQSQIPVRFSLYENSESSGSALLWQEVQEIKTTPDGTFRAYLGSNIQIPEYLFSSKELWLGVTVADTAELSPRTQLPNVAMATNSTLLNGMPVISENNTKNVVLALDSKGDLAIGGGSPVFQATDGTFSLRGSILSLETTPGSGGNIQISPDGKGFIDLQKPLQNTSYNNNLGSALGAVEVDDLLAVNATSSATSAFTVNQNDTGPIISAMSNNTAKFTVDYLGNTTVGGNLLISGQSASSLGSLTLSSGGDLTIKALTKTVIDIGTSSLVLTGNSLPFATVTSTNKDLNLSIAGGHLVLSDTNTINIGGNSSTSRFNVIANSVSGASTSDLQSDQDLYVGGTVEIDGKIRLSDQTYSFPSTSGSDSNILSTNGSGQLSWIDLGNHPSNFFRLSNGALFPANTSVDVLLGATASASAKFAFTDINSTLPKATFKSTLSISDPTGSSVELLDVDSDIRVGTGTIGCVKDADGSAIAGTCSSDERLKTNIASLSNVLDKVLSLTPSTYNWRKDEFPNMKLGSETEYGLIAQQVEKVLPELVEQNGQNGYKAIHYERLPIFLLAAIKEQQKQIQSFLQNLTVDTLSITTDRVLIAGKTIDEIFTEKFTNAFLTQNISVGTKIVSPVIESNTIFTSVISPLASDTVIINGKLAVAAQTPDQETSSLLAIRNASGTTVSSFDGLGNATLSGTLVAQNASVSGTLTADRVIAKTIDGLDETLSTLSATLSNQDQSISSSSAQLAKLRSDLQALSANPLATSSISAQFVNSDTLATAFGTFTQGLTALGPSSFIDTAISGSLTIDRVLTLSQTSLQVLGADLELQPFRQGGISFLSGLARFDENGNFTLMADANFEKNAFVKGTLAANIISPLPDSDLKIRLPGQDENGIERKLVVENASGSGVLTIDSTGAVESSGSGKFKKLLTDSFTIIRSAQADTSLTETIASSSAGTAVITNGETERTIITPFVNAESLIYLTPVSFSENTTVYLARQTENSFTIQIPKRLYADYKVNWIIVN